MPNNSKHPKRMGKAHSQQRGGSLLAEIFEREIIRCRESQERSPSPYSEAWGVMANSLEHLSMQLRAQEEKQANAPHEPLPTGDSREPKTL